VAPAVTSAWHGPDQRLIVGVYRLPIVHPAGEFHALCMVKLVTFGVALTRSA
jgi:hypothetical protein